jgi:hypothetical protein
MMFDAAPDSYHSKVNQSTTTHLKPFDEKPVGRKSMVDERALFVN